MKRIIIFLFCLIASFYETNGIPIKSNISARQISVLSQEEAFKNPYITDGLVAMWDGEWNAGFGVHDEETEIWHDLIGNHHGIVTDGGFVNYGFTGVTITEYNPSTSILTVECVFSMKEVGNVNIFSCLYQNTGFCIVSQPLNNINRWRWQVGRGNATWSTTLNSIELNSLQYTTMVVESNGIDKRIYRDGILTQRSGTQSGFDCGTYPITIGKNKATIYCIRIYNRSLSQYEIIHNNSVDKARFGL